MVSDKHWIYFPESEFVFYRVGFAHNLSPYQSPPDAVRFMLKWLITLEAFGQELTVEQVKQDLFASEF